MKRYVLGGLIVAGLLLAARPTTAHHSFAAEFDANKPIKLEGVVTKVEWTNPHVWFYFNVKDPKTGEVTNWGAEMGPPHGLQRRGWRRDTLKIGEKVIVEGSLAKNGSKRMNARTVIVAATGKAPQELDAASSQGVTP
ncbi:MAG TPA: DUF6152 family protein [Vicinamibacterales bacterium]|nr:DUF6152 family protein [Vicinamibacterales bacterium]